MNARQIYTIRQAAIGLFLKHGFEGVDMAAIAQEAGIAEAELFTAFGSRQDIVLSLYQSINTEWQLAVEALPAGTLAQRFEAAMQAKLAIVAPSNDLLGNLLGLLLTHDKLGVGAARTAHIRAIGLQVMEAIIDGADDRKRLRKKLPGLPGMLYMLHWSVLFIRVQTNDDRKTAATLGTAVRLLRTAGSVAALLPLLPVMKDISAWSAAMLESTDPGIDPVDDAILRVLFNHRKTTDTDAACLAGTCAVCRGMHLSKVHYFTRQQKPLHFILPAFPAKSPNREKVLGSLPDLGEEIALQSLEDLCREIGAVYPPGARVTICSDGRIFSALVGVTDDDVTAYVAGIRAMIAALDLRHIDVVNLEDLLEGPSFDALRAMVLDRYGENIDDLSARVKTSPEFRSLFNGIHRFISDDRRAVYPGRSASKVKEESAGIALHVIRNSNAWTRFLAYVYPDAIRLSIHPYPAHSDKIGIRLTKAADNWLTPWHGVVVLQQDGYLLMKKTAALALGARLVERDGRPCFYTLIPET